MSHLQLPPPSRHQPPAASLKFAEGSEYRTRSVIEQANGFAATRDHVQHEHTCLMNHLLYAGTDGTFCTNYGQNMVQAVP